MIRLRGLTWNHTRGYAPMATTAQVFTDRHQDMEILWERRSLWAFGEQSLADLPAAYDLMVIDHPMIGWAARAGAFVPFDQHLSAAAMERLRHSSVGASQESYHYDGHDYALAVDAACQVAVARGDLLEQLGEETPTTWDRMLDLARRTDRVALPLNAIDVYSAFLTLCAHLGSPAGASGQPGGRFADRDTALRAIAMLVELATLVDEQCVTANPIATLNRMATTDEIVYCPLLFGYSNYSRSGYVPHVLDFADIPVVDGRPPAGSCLGGAGIAVSAMSAHIEAAVRYASWVADPTIQSGDYVRAGGQPAASAAWDDPTANLLTRDFFSSTRASIEASYLRPRHPGFPEFQTAAAGLLRSAVVDDAVPEKVLDQVDERYGESLVSVGEAPAQPSDVDA